MWDTSPRTTRNAVIHPTRYVVSSGLRPISRARTGRGGRLGLAFVLGHHQNDRQYRKADSLGAIDFNRTHYVKFPHSPPHFNAFAGR